MKTIMFATPISLEEAERLSCFDYSIVYFDPNKKRRKKLKIASADYDGTFMDCDAVLEASKSDAVMFLRHVPRQYIKSARTSLLTLKINDDREIERVISNSKYYSNVQTFSGNVLEKRLK